MTTKIYIVRHGESLANRNDMCGGNTPLTQVGIEQAKVTKTLLSVVHFDDAFSSDFERAVDTAAIIYGHAIPMQNQLPAFRERNFGSLENEPNAAWMVIKDAWEEKYAALPFEQRCRYEYADDIESDGTLCDRVMAGLQVLATKHPGKTLLVASSAGPVRVLLMHLGFADFLTVGSFKNAGYVELGFDGKKFSIIKVVGIQQPTVS
jgi:broad specificity phosphatase PhoE